MSPFLQSVLAVSPAMAGLQGFARNGVVHLGADHSGGPWISQAPNPHYGMQGSWLNYSLFVSTRKEIEITFYKPKWNTCNVNCIPYIVYFSCRINL